MPSEIWLPTPSADGTWRNPVSGQWLRYLGPDGSESDYLDPNYWETDTYGSGSVLVDGHWYRDMEDAGMVFCEYGDHYVTDDVWGRGNHGYCPDCTEQYEEDSYNDDCGEPVGDAVTARCGCQTGRALTHYHPITEQVVCAMCADIGTGFEPIPELVAA